MRISVGAIRRRAVVGRPERLGGEEPMRRAPEAGEPARAITGNFRTTNLGVVMAESGLRSAKSLLNNRNRRHVLVTQGRPGQVLIRLRYSHGTTDGLLQRVLRTGGRDIPAGGRANGIRHQDLHRRRGMGGAGGKESGLPTGAGALDGRVSGRERGGGVRDGAKKGQNWLGGRPTWDSFRGHTTRSAQPLRAP